MRLRVVQFGFISLLLSGVFLQLLATQSETKEDFLSWTMKHCDDVIKKSIKSEGMGSSFGNATLFPGGGAGVNIVSAIWVSEASAKAIARKIQLEERQHEERAREIRKELWNNDAYTLLVFSISGTSVGSSGWASLDPVKARSTTTIFLQDKKSKDSFVRINDLGQFPYSISNPAISGSVLMRFDRKTQQGDVLIKTLDQEIELEIALPGGGKSRVGFKLKDLPTSSAGGL